jgi:hypothetical protein
MVKRTITRRGVMVCMWAREEGRETGREEERDEEREEEWEEWWRDQQCCRRTHWLSQGQRRADSALFTAWR